MIVQILLLITLLSSIVLSFPFFTPKFRPIPLNTSNKYKIIRGEVLCMEIDMVYAPNTSTIQLYYEGDGGERKLISKMNADENGHFELKAPNALGSPLCQFFLTASSKCDVLNKNCNFVKTEKVPKSEPDLFSIHPGRHQYTVSIWIRTDLNEPKCNNSTTTTIKTTSSTGEATNAVEKKLPSNIDDEVTETEDIVNGECLRGLEEW